MHYRSLSMRHTPGAFESWALMTTNTSIILHSRLYSYVWLTVPCCLVWMNPYLAISIQPTPLSYHLSIDMIRGNSVRTCLPFIQILCLNLQLQLLTSTSHKSHALPHILPLHFVHTCPKETFRFA
jgi:hypothetical protein